MAKALPLEASAHGFETEQSRAQHTWLAKALPLEAFTHEKKEGQVARRTWPKRCRWKSPSSPARKSRLCSWSAACAQKSRWSAVRVGRAVQVSKGKHK